VAAGQREASRARWHDSLLHKGPKTANEGRDVKESPTKFWPGGDAQQSVQTQHSDIGVGGAENVKHLLRTVRQRQDDGDHDEANDGEGEGEGGEDGRLFSRRPR
jgi:hypothetical protein